MVHCRMQVKIVARDAGDRDCRRTDYLGTCNGRTILLAGSALDTVYTFREIVENVSRKFGPDARINWGETTLPRA